MWKCHILRARLWAVCFVAMTSGCQLFHTYRPVTVLVRDAETKTPISEASVTIAYLVMLDPFAPENSSGESGEDGIVHLRAAPYHSPIAICTFADGYLTHSEFLSPDSIRTLRSSSNGSPDVVIELYRGKGATVEFVLPDTFRGLIIVEPDMTNPGNYVPGQRLFSVDVPPNGIVAVKAPPQLVRESSYPERYRARFANGSEMDNYPSATAVGFRWLTSFGDTQYFVVGTQQDLEAAKGLIYSSSPSGGKSLDLDKAKALKERLQKRPGNAGV